MICEREDLGHPATHGPMKGQDLSCSGERILRFWSLREPWREVSMPRLWKLLLNE